MGRARCLLILVAMVGCGDAAVVMVSGPPPGSGISSNDELAGFWKGNWGDMVLRVVGGEVRGAYSHDSGTVVMSWYSDGVMRGWWCETPSRTPTADAGDVEFRFTRSASLDLDGRWRYGASGTFKEDWDLKFTAATGPDALEKRFADAAAFCRHP